MISQVKIAYGKPVALAAFTARQVSLLLGEPNRGQRPLLSERELARSR